jgi:hypothetical protein
MRKDDDRCDRQAGDCDGDRRHRCAWRAGETRAGLHADDDCGDGGRDARDSGGGPNVPAPALLHLARA